MSLKEEGFRYVHRAGARDGFRWQWVHPSTIQQDDIDCTDMSDDEFDAFVSSLSQ